MQVIAHRGASGYAPENTRAAFEKAIEMQADAIETDVSMTVDGHLVLIHDTFVDRTSNGAGPVADFTLAELQALDFGDGQRVLTLDESIDEFLDRIPFCYEVKDPRTARPLLDRLIARGKLDRVQVTSFFWFPLLEAREISAEVELGFLTPQFTPALIERIVRRGFQQICPHVSTLTGELVDLAHNRGLLVRAWGISKREDAALVRSTGADGATTNWPDWF